MEADHFFAAVVAAVAVVQAWEGQHDLAAAVLAIAAAAEHATGLDSCKRGEGKDQVGQREFLVDERENGEAQ